MPRPAREPFSLALIALACAATLAHAPSRAEGERDAAAASEAGPASPASPEDAARRAKVAVRVGARTVTVGELEDRLAGIPPFQLATFGASRDAVLRAYVEQVVVRDLLLAEGAEARGLAKGLPTSQLVLRALSTATLRALHKDIPSGAGIPAEDVQRYYDANRSRFDSPERINLWRILVKTREDAQTVLDAAKREPTITKYNELARERSIDKATNLRGGNLGFVAPDGTSNEAGLRIDPALLDAARRVKDGDFVPQPVAEGDAFAVVWRRTTVPPSKRTVEEAAAQIRTSLYRERIDAADKKLIDELRKGNVKSVDYGLLGFIELPPFDAGITIPKASPRPPQAPQAPAPPASPRASAPR